MSHLVSLAHSPPPHPENQIPRSRRAGLKQCPAIPTYPFIGPSSPGFPGSWWPHFLSHLWVWPGLMHARHGVQPYHCWGVFLSQLPFVPVSNMTLQSSLPELFFPLDPFQLLELTLQTAPHWIKPCLKLQDSLVHLAN